MRKILFDTDVLIEHLRGNERVKAEIDRLYDAQALLAYTAVSEAEIIRGIRSNERDRAETILAQLECLELSRTVGRKAGEYLKAYAKSHGLQIADALIAAAAVIHHFALCTFNWKHYPMMEVGRYRIEL